MSRKAYPKAALHFLSQPPAPNQLFRKAILRRCQMSANGPSRHFAVEQQPRRFRREADINWQAKSADLVGNDPKL